MYHCVHSSTIQNSQDIETTWISFSRKMDKEDVEYTHTHTHTWASLAAQLVKNPPTNAGDTSSIPGPGRSSGEWNGNQLSIPAWKTPWTGAWLVIVHGLATELHTHTHTHTHTQNEILICHVKDWNLAICDRIDGPRGCYAEVNKSDRKSNTIQSHLYVGY